MVQNVSKMLELLSSNSAGNEIFLCHVEHSFIQSARTLLPCVTGIG
jgi:hypothetical protein